MANKEEFAREDWLLVEQVVSQIVDEDAWDWCSRQFIEKIEESINEDKRISFDEYSGGDHMNIPIPVQIIPFALDACRYFYLYYKKNGHLPESLNDLKDLVPKSKKEVRDFLFNHFSAMLNLFIIGLQLV